MDLPTAFYDLPADAYPMILQVLDNETKKSLWTTPIEGPGAVEIPSFFPRVVRTRIWDSKGICIETTPDGVTSIYDLSAELADIKNGASNE